MEEYGLISTRVGAQAGFATPPPWIDLLARVDAQASFAKRFK